MKRLFRIAAVAVLASSLFASGEALADPKGHGDGRGRAERSERQARGGDQRDWRGERGDRGGGRNDRGDRSGRDDRSQYSRDRGDRDNRGERAYPRDRDERGGGRRWDAGPPDAYAPPGFARRQPPANYGVRRGGQVPPGYSDREVSDYGRHRLRPPPPGYTWVRMGNRYALVSRSTGQIFDVIGD